MGRELNLGCPGEQGVLIQALWRAGLIPEAGAVLYRVEMKKQEERHLQPPEQWA